jgi:hypothetical protein
MGAIGAGVVPEAEALGTTAAEALALPLGIGVGTPASSALAGGVPSPASTSLGTGLFEAAFGRHQISPHTDAPRVRQLRENPYEASSSEHHVRLPKKAPQRWHSWSFGALSIVHAST